MHNEEIIKYATEGLKRKYKNRPTTIKDFDIALESAKKNFAKEYQEKFLKGEDINTNTIKLENRLKQLEEENTYVAHNEKDDFHNKTHIFFDGENRNYDTDTIKNLSVSSDVAANRIVDAIKNNKTDSKLNGLATTINDIINADNSVINPVIHEMNKIFGFGDIKVFVRNLKTNHGGLYKTKNGYAIVINSNKPFERITINHEIGHLFLKNAKYGNPIISKICDECYNLTKAKDDFLKSIGCESVNDVNFKFENGKISLEDFINSFENKVKYETCAEELYVEGFANTNKYVDIEKFNSWYNDNIKNDVDDYLRKSYSTGDYYSKIYPKLIKRVNKFFDENSEVFNGQKYSRKSNTNSRVDTSLSSPWGGEVSEYSSYKIGKQDSRRTNARNSGANTYQRPQGMKGVFQEPSNNKATKYNSREEFNGVPEQPKTVADSKPIEYTPVSNNYLKDEFGSSYNSAKARKYIANTSKDTEKTLIELGLLDEAQAANRLKQQSILNGTDKAYFRSTSKSKTGIDINKDYNATANTKEGLFGKKTQKGVHETGSAEDITRYEINRNLHAHYTKNVIDYVANKLALPIKDGRIKDGYIGVNKNILSHMVHGRMSSEWYNTMVKGEEAIRKAFKDEGVANAWVEIANKNKADDFQIPKTVFNTLADGSAENAAVYWDRYARFDNPKGLVKGIGKYTKAVNEALLNGFKRRVLTSGSFFLNNRIGNQIMLYMHSDNAVDYLKSIFKAGTIKDIDVPNEIIQNNIAEAAKDALVRRTYTGHNAVDNAINLFNGQYIDTSSLKGMKKAGATGANIVIGLPNKAFNKVSEIVMKFNDAFEKFERKQRFSQLVDKEKAKLIKATGQKLVKDSEVIKHIKSNSEITEAVIREIEDTLGNYRTFNKFEKNIVKQIVPFYSWYRTISRHTMKFATKHPERVAKLRLELRAIGLDGKGHSDQKEYQRFAAPTGMIDSRSKKELLVNKEHAMPYNTFREDIGWNPYVQRGIEAVRGKKTFRNSEITNSRYTRQKKYDKESNRYKTAYWDAKNKDWVRDLDGNVKYESDYKLGALPLAPRVGYLAKGLITDTFAPYLNNSLVNAEQLSGAVSNRFTKDKNRSERGTWNTYDKNYDASFGGYNSGDIVGHQIAKGQWKNFERYASNNLSNKTKFVNALLGVGLQNKGELSKKEKLKAYKEKYKNRRKSN